jgi:hypothetical protein
LPLSSQLAVELGHVHPLRLLAFERLFDKGKRLLFLTGQAQRAALLLPATPFVAAERLIELGYSAASAPASEAAPVKPTAREPAFGAGPGPLRLNLRLVIEPTPSEPPVATLLPWTQARTLGRLLYLLPPPLFAELRAAGISDGILLVGDSGAIGNLPVGQLLYAAAPSVLVPLGMSLVPRLRGELLREKLAGTADGYVIFAPGAAPFSVARSHFAPISSAFVTQLLAAESAVSPVDPPPLPTTVVNDPLGLFFPLWGKP